jgi:hypothetical protein
MSRSVAKVFPTPTHHQNAECLRQTTELYDAQLRCNQSRTSQYAVRSSLKLKEISPRSKNNKKTWNYLQISGVGNFKQPVFLQSGLLLKPLRSFQNLPIREIDMGTILLVILILLLVGGLPVFPHSRSWGYGPSGIVGVVLVVILILLLLGKI